MKSLLATIAVLGTVLVASAPPASAGQAAYCDGYARDYANRNAHPVATTGVGAAFGAGVGCLIGAAVAGRCGTGAAIGAGGGAVAGAANASGKWQRFYNSAYYKCMNGAPASVCRAAAGLCASAGRVESVEGPVRAEIRVVRLVLRHLPAEWQSGLSASAAPDLHAAVGPLRQGEGARDVRIVGAFRFYGVLRIAAA